MYKESCVTGTCHNERLLGETGYVFRKTVHWMKIVFSLDKQGVKANDRCRG